MTGCTPLIQYQIDAFANRPFTGNPAAVILTDKALSEGLMQSLAEENNLSETAFLVALAEAGHYDLRWFTPTVEIGFCGHATIASAHALIAEHKVQTADDGALHFQAQIGVLTVRLNDAGHYTLRAPVAPGLKTPVTPAMRSAFPVAIKSAFHAGPNLYIVFENADDIDSFAPDFSQIIPLSSHGVGITAQSTGGDYDFISRFFVPAEGINEDPVTGSAHAALGPYWAGQMEKASLTAYQASARGGVLHLRIGPQSIDISGPAITVMKSELYL